ncbi:dipeptidyl peptidase 2-like isoform X1 [Patella vulgata]|uniref:dipeptidyl peptidase 2-like isoform X1 n=1 Tax=Patella vulgata TaxID=6465 RepID=UPI0024A94A4C|nr:dipeptidyl peptidase 2-like isoform X1 [Patella vulgata]
MIKLGQILLVCLAYSSVLSNVSYKELYFEQTIDHFNPLSYGEKKFKQRYLLQDQWFDIVDRGPILFYTGNEGPITTFWNNTGFMFDIAPQFRALVVFAEHRFYGKSLPFGDDSFKGNNIGLLTIEQALADYALLIHSIKQTYNAGKSAVITFGGSYGGMLSAYMRFKYPNLVDGAIAASAPMYLLSNVIDPSQFFVRVTADFKQSNPNCSVNIRKAFNIMDDMAKSGDTGLNMLSEKFMLCSKLNETGYNHMVGWIRNAFVSLAMFDYPYPTNFESELPAFPVDKSCDFMVNKDDLVKGLAQITALFYNGTNGKLPCFDIWEEYVECADPSGCGLGPDSLAWDIQACSEIPMLFTTDGVQDMFLPINYTAKMRNDYCKTKYGLVPRDKWASVNLWGFDVSPGSNILFSNGFKDPWAFAGVLHDLGPNLTSIIIHNGAHHLDLRGHNTNDPVDVIKARNMEILTIRQWINAVFPIKSL